MREGRKEEEEKICSSIKTINKIKKNPRLCLATVSGFPLQPVSWVFTDLLLPWLCHTKGEWVDSRAEGAAEAAEDTGQGKQALPPKC